LTETYKLLNIFCVRVIVLISAVWSKTVCTSLLLLLLHLCWVSSLRTAVTMMKSR